MFHNPYATSRLMTTLGHRAVFMRGKCNLAMSGLLYCRQCPERVLSFELLTPHWSSRMWLWLIGAGRIEATWEMYPCRHTFGVSEWADPKASIIRPTVTEEN